MTMDSAGQSGSDRDTGINKDSACSERRVERSIAIQANVSMKLLREWPTHGEISSLSSSTDGALVLGVGSDVLVADIY